MTRLPKPIVAAINGVAAGSGMSLAMACDWRIAADKAAFLQAFVSIGLVPDSGSTWFLPRLIGRQRALDLMRVGPQGRGDQSARMGAGESSRSPERLLEEASRLATHYASAATCAIGHIKRNLDYAESHSLEETLAVEAVSQAECGASADHKEGMQAFLEKRSPVYQGE